MGTQLYTRLLQKARARARQDSAGAPEPSAAQSVFAEVAGIESQPEINGQLVQVLRYAEGKGRYAVQLLHAKGGCKTSKTLMLKPKNIVPAWLAAAPCS